MSTFVVDPSVVGDFPVIAAPPASRTVRVLHVVNGEHYAGAERVQDLLAAELPKLGYEVGFATLKQGEFAGQRHFQAAPLHELAMTSRLDVGQARKLARLIRSENYGLVHTHTPRSALIGQLAAALARVPWVHHVHSPAGQDTTHRWRNLRNSMLEQASLWRAERLFTVSESLGRYVVGRYVSPSRVRVVHNGVPGQSRLTPRATPGPTWTIGTVALFRPRKGLEILLEALAQLRQQGLPVELRALGRFETPEYESQIRRQAADLKLEDVIDWVGFVRDVPAALGELDLFVLPSLFGEGLPMVVLEAMAAGVPVVATRVEGVPEAVLDGETGVIVPPLDATQLAHGIANCVTGAVDWQQLRTTAWERHRDRFSSAAMARSVAQVYDEVLHRGE